MIRKLVQLTQAQAAAVRRIARRRGISEAAVIREAVDRVAVTPDAARVKRALAVLGKYRSKRHEPVGREHDRYLEEIYRG